MKAFPCPCPQVLHSIALTLPSSVQNQQTRALLVLLVARGSVWDCATAPRVPPPFPFPCPCRWVHDGPQTPHRPAPPALPALPLLQQPAPRRGGLRLQGPGPAHGEQRHRPVHGRQDPAVRGLVSTRLLSRVGWEHAKGLVRSIWDLLGVRSPSADTLLEVLRGRRCEPESPPGLPGKARQRSPRTGVTSCDSSSRSPHQLQKQDDGSRLHHLREGPSHLSRHARGRPAGCGDG